MNSTVKGLQGQLAYWMQVGDSFQIERTLHHLAEMNSITYAGILDSRGDRRFEKSRGEATSWILFSKTFPIESELGRQAVLELRYVLSPWLFIIILLFFLLIHFSFHQLFGRLLHRLAERLSAPVLEFSAQVQNAHSLRDLQELGMSQAPIAELEQLADKIKDMSLRIQSAESRKQDLEKQEAVFQVARRVAHDIRSPVSALTIALDSRELPTGLSEVIRAATQRVREIADDLLNHSRAQIEHTPFRFPDDLRTLIDEKAYEFRAHPKQATLVFENELKKSFDWKRGGSSQFKRSLSNIINNAWEAVDSGGKIVVRCRKLESFYEVEIEDNGRGIPEEILSHLGQREVSSSTTGSGIGVLSSAAFLKSFGGSLTYQSEVHKGTRAVMRLPHCAETE